MLETIIRANDPQSLDRHDGGTCSFVRLGCGIFKTFPLMPCRTLLMYRYKSIPKRQDILLGVGTAHYVSH